MTKKNFRKDLELLLYINIAVIILLLSIFNLSTKVKKNELVLGATDEISKNERLYWEDMVKKHPTYRDAWVELGRMDIVEKIDPNYN